MKKIIVLITVCIFGLNAMGEDYQTDNKSQPKETKAKYCAVLKDGKIMVQQNKADLTTNVTLANGTVIKTDGTITKQDGTSTMLKNGECVDNNGDMINHKSINKMQKKEDKMPPK